MKHLAENLSFRDLVQRFPMVSAGDVRKILHQAAAFYGGEGEDLGSQDLDDYFLYTDGASRGNPGEAGAGAVILDKDGNVVREVTEYLGEKTNNTAEYRALILGLMEVLRLGGSKVRIFSDSELIVKQVNGVYNVRNQGLKVLYNNVKELLENFVRYDIRYISREKNRHADRLANKAIDERRGERFGP